MPYVARLLSCHGTNFRSLFIYCGYSKDSVFECIEGPASWSECHKIFILSVLVGSMQAQVEKAKEEINEKKRQIRMLEQRIKSAVTSQPVANGFEMSQVHFSDAMIWRPLYKSCVWIRIMRKCRVLSMQLDLLRGDSGKRNYC